MARFSEEVKAEIINEQVQLLEALSGGTENLQDLERLLLSIDKQLIALGVRSVGDQEPSIH